MKRCPQCDFIYLDTDELCDLDGAKLIQANESELALGETTRTNTRHARSNSRLVIIACLSGVLLLALVFVAYALLTRSRQQAQAQIPSQHVTEPTPVSVTVPTPEPSPSPEASPVVSPKSPTQVEQAKRTAVSKSPVSTSSDQKGSGSIWIRLSNGARIEADEVWRTKEGVWYRRNGVVTLIKANRVKAIEKK
jgi:type IV secretory pathway VirB10-like protein